METSFTDHSHTGCVRAVAVSENGILATGSSDESIRLFNLKKRKEIGSLIHHEGLKYSLLHLIEIKNIVILLLLLVYYFTFSVFIGPQRNLSINAS